MKLCPKTRLGGALQLMRGGGCVADLEDIDKILPKLDGSLSKGQSGIVRVGMDGVNRHFGRKNHGGRRQPRVRDQGKIGSMTLACE